MKKGDLSINIIVIAALALLVLVIIAVIFMNRAVIFGGTVNDCLSKSGQVCKSAATGCGEGYTKSPGQTCFKPGTKEADTSLVCCVGIQ
jgi:hypothetical protein